MAANRLWVYVRDDRPCGSHDPPAVWFRYSPDRQGKHPREHLKRYRGILQADAYSGYEGVYNSGRVQHAACCAHARRYYWEVHEDNKFAPGSVVEQGLHRIAALYAIESDIRGQLPEERQRQRQARAAPLLKDLHDWLRDMVGRVSAKSELARAIGYTLTHWQALTRYCDDGHIEIDTDAFDKSLSSPPPAKQALSWQVAALATQRRSVGTRVRPWQAKHAPDRAQS
ncbi:IS66 family transposase [Variovorax sp. JS1663]|uniref:IS66 family transposase n=1 Tax=Variovorax sp. JS1663 TaxID=1851577 RepID=UPI001302A943|nr:transposase [Variovorax sp. JS1663]